MTSLISKHEEDDNLFVEGGLTAHFSKKHYRPHHRNINGKISKFNNDSIFIVGEKDNGEGFVVDVGVDSRRWRVSNSSYNDEMKDANKRY